MNTVFKGEHLFPGQLGQFFIIVSFGAALLSFLSYFFAATDKDKNASWQMLGRIGFFINSAAIMGMGSCLFYILYNHYFEYHYAWSYTSRNLPTYYLVSGFWNGQEGGFLLWSFWQGVLGNILIWKAKSWERPVMTVVAFSQTVLATMVLGIDIFGARIGSSPFLLLRNSGMEAPIFSQPNYLDFIKDGQGMNPSLQNYWMIIHPPTLFLGFASIVVPFAYAVAGLWQKRYKEWIQPAISYTLFSAMVLGTGVIMGSFWAYESLNFGGFWAWDPVENASVFPWLIMVGALHVLIVFKNTGHSYIMATILVLTSFVMVWYSSFLARSGILGDSSVHAFTDLGMFWHLVIGILIFLVLSVYLLVIRWKELPRTKKDEDTYSREFWMFVGSVFLGLSCLQLLVVTSVPVYNAIFGTKIAPPSNPVTLYNVFQAAFALVVTLLSGVTQFLKYRKTDVSRFVITTTTYLVFAGLITALVVYVTGIYHLKVVFVLVMWGSVYSVIANGKVLADAFKGKFKLAGSAVAHIGFGFLMIGALIAAGTSKVVSENTTGETFSADFAKDQNPKENILVYKNEPLKMGKYLVTYVGDSISSPNHFYKIDYKEVDADGKVKDEFMLKPKVQVNRQMGGFASSPDTRHYLFHDLYTHITMTNSLSLTEGTPDTEHGEEDDDKNYDEPVPHDVAPGDTIHYRDGYILFKSINREANVQNIPLKTGDIAIGADLEVYTHGKMYKAEPVYLIRDSSAYDFAKKVEDAGLKLRFAKVLPQEKKIQIMVYQTPESKKKFIVMRAIDFPYINFFWSGTIIMVIGFLLSIFRRNKELKTV